MKKILISAVVIVLISPQIAMASWWNPLSWNIWNIFKESPKQTENISTNSSADTLSDVAALRKEIDALKSQQASSSSIKTSEVNNRSEKITPTVNNSAVIKAQIAIALKAKADEQGRIDLASSQRQNAVVVQAPETIIPDATFQMKSQCASLGQQREVADNAIKASFWMTKDKYGYSPSLKTCIYAAAYSDVDSVWGTYWNLMTGEKIPLVQSGVWLKSTVLVPASQFIYNRYVYDCNHLPAFMFMSSVNQNGQGGLVNASAGCSNTDSVYVNTYSVDTSKAIMPASSLPNYSTSKLKEFWTEYDSLIS